MVVDVDVGVDLEMSVDLEMAMRKTQRDNDEAKKENEQDRKIYILQTEKTLYINRWRRGHNMLKPAPFCFFFSSTVDIDEFITNILTDRHTVCVCMGLSDVGCMVQDGLCLRCMSYSIVSSHTALLWFIDIQTSEMKL